MIYTRNLVARDRAKIKAELEDKELKKKIQHMKETRETKWKNLTTSSPFAVNLVAEDERIAEEGRVRLAEEEKKRKEFLQRRDQAKNEIVLKVA